MRGKPQAVCTSLVPQIRGNGVLHRSGSVPAHTHLGTVGMRLRGAAASMAASPQQMPPAATLQVLINRSSQNPHRVLIWAHKGLGTGAQPRLMTQLKVIALVSDIMCTVPQDNNSRSGAPPLSLHHSSQRVNLSSKTKIKKEKRKVKNLITRTRSNPDLPTSKSKALPLVQNSRDST